MMKRVIALLTCGSALSACGSVPSMDLASFGGGFGGGSAQTVNVRVESQPEGAEARGPSGSCRTPCALALPANGTSTVNFTLQGFQPQAVPVSVRPVSEAWELSDTGATAGQVAIDPNPVVAELEPVPPPPPPRRTRRAAPRQPAQQPAPAQNQQPGSPPPPPGFR